MKRLSVWLLALALAGQVLAQEYQVVEKQFKAYETLRIETVSGDVEVVKGKSDQILVKVRYRVEPRDAFEPRFYESGSQLKLEEDWVENSRRSDVLWTLTVPEKIEIRFSTASGDFSAEDLALTLEASTASGDIQLDGIRGKVDVRTASGDVTIKDGEGRFELSTASGDIELDRVQGEIECTTASGDINLAGCQAEVECSTASGDVEADGLALQGIASFSTASGDVVVRLGAALADDVELSTASGSVTLDLNGHPLTGLFIMTAREDRGRISAPFAFDKEEIIDRHGRDYMQKTAKIKKDSPRITLDTASGSAVVKK